MTNSPILSVIITTKDSEQFIRACICSIKASSYYGFGRVEIILVDNFSKDRTRKIAQHYKCRVFKRGPERSAQRNYGVKMAKGKYCIILDVDMTVHVRLLSECVKMMDDYEALYIPERIVGDTKSFWIRVRDFERSFYDGTRIDAIRFFKKDHFMLFDEGLCGAEDWAWDREFVGRKGQATYPVYHNEGGFNVNRYLKKKGYYAQWLKQYKKRYGNCPELNPIYRFIGVFIEKGKWTRVIKHPILFMGIIYLQFMKGVKYLCTKQK